VCLFGFAYKKNTGDTRMSQSAFLVDYLSNKCGIRV
jgi:UDPglucose 6-dehydrogenase